MIKSLGRSLPTDHWSIVWSTVTRTDFKPLDGIRLEWIFEKSFAVQSLLCISVDGHWASWSGSRLIIGTDIHWYWSRAFSGSLPQVIDWCLGCVCPFRWWNSSLVWLPNLISTVLSLLQYSQRLFCLSKLPALSDVLRCKTVNLNEIGDVGASEVLKFLLNWSMIIDPVIGFINFSS